MKKFHLWQVSDSEKKTYCIQYIRFSWAVQASNSVELMIKPVHFSSLCVWFESIHNKGFDIHIEIYELMWKEHLGNALFRSEVYIHKQMLNQIFKFSRIIDFIIFICLNKEFMFFFNSRYRYACFLSAIQNLGF